MNKVSDNTPKSVNIVDFLKSKLNKTAILFLVLFLLAGTTTLVLAGYVYFTEPSLTVQHITQQFVDLNGDGKTDLIISADVVIDQSGTNFTQPASKKP